MATTKLIIKLFVDKSSNSLLFAEAGKDFVDFLFSLLTLPLGSVMSLVAENKTMSCFGHLYESADKLDSSSFLSNQHKDLVLKPVIPICLGTIPLLPQDMLGNYYRCSRKCLHMTSKNGVDWCPKCLCPMNQQIPYVAPGTSKVNNTDAGGYVGGGKSYMVMDDLAVMPASSVSSIALLNKCNVQSVSSIEVKEVEVTLKEGMELVSYSMSGSRKVLSDVFLVKKESSSKASALKIVK